MHAGLLRPGTHTWARNSKEHSKSKMAPCLIKNKIGTAGQAELCLGGVVAIGWSSQNKVLPRARDGALALCFYATLSSISGFFWEKHYMVLDLFLRRAVLIGDPYLLSLLESKALGVPEKNLYGFLQTSPGLKTVTLSLSTCLREIPLQDTSRLAFDSLIQTAVIPNCRLTQVGKGRGI